MLKYKTAKLFADDRVTAKQVNHLYGDFYNYFKNCNNLPRHWLLTFILNYLFYCQVNALDNPTNYLLLEKANDNWVSSFENFTFEDIRIVLDYLEQKEIILNQVGYQLTSSKPVSLLTAISSVWQKANQPIKLF